MGLLEDDSGIDYGEDFTTVAPDYKRYLHVKGRYGAGVIPHLEPRTPVIQQLFGEFGESEKVATAMFSMAVRARTKDNRFKHLNQEPVDTWVEEMLCDLLRVYK